MKRKLLIYLIAATISFGNCIPAYANDEYSTILTEITPQYENANYIAYSFEFIDDSEIVYDINVKTNSATKISTYMELQKKTNSGWKKVIGSTKTSNSKSIYYYKQATVSNSETYRVYYKTTIYYNTDDSEVITNYKY